MSETRQATPQFIREALNRKALAATRHRAALGRLLDMSESEVLAIQHLGRAGHLTPGQVGTLLQLSSGGTTALVHRLEAAGHAIREPNPDDKRSTILRLTPSIERRAGELFAPLVGELDALASSLSPDERRSVGRFLERIADAAERHADELVRRAQASAHAELGVPAPGLWA